MNKNRKNEIKVGIVSVIGVILLILALYFTKSFSFNDNKIPVLFEFSNALGINSGSPIYINGVRCGVVDKIYLKSGKVLINGSLDSITELKSDCSASIQILEITGGKKIELYPGSSPQSFNPSNIIIGKESFDLGSTIGKLGDITSDLNAVVEKVDTLISSSIDLIRDTNIKSILNNSSAAVLRLTTLLNNPGIEKTINNVSHISDELDKLLADNKLLINRIADNLDTSSVQLKTVLSQTSEFITDAKKSLNNINIFIEDIKISDGTIGKLLYDTSLSAKMVNMIDSLDSLLLHIKKHGLNANIRLGSRP